MNNIIIRDLQWNVNLIIKIKKNNNVIFSTKDEAKMILQQI
jgi:hypothetical protein